MVFSLSTQHMAWRLERGHAQIMGTFATSHGSHGSHDSESHHPVTPNPPPLCCRGLPAHPMLLTLRSSLEKSLFCTNNTQACTGMYRTKCAENVLRWHLQVSKTVGTQRMGNVLGDAGNSQLMDVDGTFRYHQPGHQPLKPVSRRDQGCQCQSCSKVRK